MSSWIAVLLLGLAPSSFARAEERRADAPEVGRIMSDTTGRITEVLLHFDSEFENELARVYRDLFASLGDGVRVRVLCETPESANAFARRWQSTATANGRDIDVVNVGMPLSIWARDRCIARTGGAAQRAASFVPSVNPYYEFEKQNDLRTQRMLYRGLLGPTVLRSWLHLEGGNVIANGKQVFIGANVSEENDCDLPDAQLNLELSRICGRPWKLIGEKIDTLPWDHVDMYITPIDDELILVASAAAGREYLVPGCNGEPAIDATFEVQPALDQVAEELRDMGFRVLRLPAVFGATGDWIMTYNNVVMEQRDGRRIVFMPTYNVPDMDRDAADAYARLGFDVKTIDVSGVYEFGGAVRCIVNVVERGPDEKGRRNPPQLARQHGRIRVLDVSTCVPRRVTRAFGSSLPPAAEPWVETPPPTKMR